MSQLLSPAASHDNVDEPAPKRLSNRSYVACKRCHTHKVKCTGETPKCRNCQQARNPTECCYPIRDRKISVAESYLKKLEAEVKELKRKRPVEDVPYISPPDTISEARDGGGHVSRSGETIAEAAESYIEEDLNFSSDETFIQPHYIGEAACTTFGSRLHQYLTTDDRPSPPCRPHYYKNQRLHRIASTECQLPNRNYAQLLVRVVLRFIGPDYHLLLKRSFLEKLEETYRLNAYEDPIWLCRLFVVFALGELYSERASKTKSGRGVPGTAYFLKAMAMFQDLHEEPTIPYIETLLLISFYSNALNRRNTAYTFAGLALRLSLTLGLHRKIPENQPISPREREHRVRVWWTVYILDRVCSSKVGLPIMLRDEDIDVPPPSMDGLTDLERDDFHDPSHINAQLELAKITGNILNDIYRIPQPGRANTFVQGVQRILKSLWSWRETLPPILKFNQQAVPMYSSRSVASLHLNFSQCVILTTRPIFFYLLRSYHQNSQPGSPTPPQPLSPVTDALSEACVHAARTSSAILAQLWVDGNLATYGFFDALSIFSSTLILMMSSCMRYKAHDSDADAVDTALSLLKAMRDDGNMPAHDYYEQLVQLKNDLDGIRDQMSGNSQVGLDATEQSNGLQLLLAASSGSFADATALNRGPLAAAAPVPDNMSFAAALETFDTGIVFEDPFLRDFLDQQQPYVSSWTADSMAGFGTDAGTVASAGLEGNAQWNFDWKDANLFGTT